MGSSTATRWQMQALRQGKEKIIHLLLANTYIVYAVWQFYSDIRLLVLRTTYPFAALLTSYLIMRKLVEMCALMTSILGMNPIAVMLSVAHRVAEISLLVGTWHAVDYLWGAAPNVTEISPGSWQRRG